jgi:VIT1/CCC1 family predicted Fe2+/Mn2+ transporter
MVDTFEGSESSKTVVEQPNSLIHPTVHGLTRKSGSTELVRSVFIVDLCPLRRPALSADFNRMTIVERTLHALEYQARVLEFRLGANGWIRAWMLASLRILLLVVIPLAAFLIGLAFLVPAASGVANFFIATESATQHALWTVIYGILTMLAVAFGIGLFATLVRLARRKS